MYKADGGVLALFESVQTFSEKSLTPLFCFEIVPPHTENKQTTNIMRTKTLLLTAAVIAVGIGASQAQIFSVNAVGYVNVTIKPGYNLIANPLNGTNNQISTVMPATSLPDDTTLLTWNGTIQDFNQADFVASGAWYDQLGNPSHTVVAPGAGFFIYKPNAGNLTATFVGEVPQGTLSNPIGQNFGFYSSIVPQSAGLSTLAFPGVVDMTYQTFNTTIQDYDQAYQYVGTIPGYPSGWADPAGNPADPTPAVAQGFLIFNPGSAQSWNRTFSVNN